MIDIVDSNGNKISEIRCNARSVEVSNKMKRDFGIVQSYQLSSYTTGDGTRRDCWKPSRTKTLATLIGITHNQ
jgi:hypothetical protein